MKIDKEQVILKIKEMINFIGESTISLSLEMHDAIRLKLKVISNYFKGIRLSKRTDLD